MFRIGDLIVYGTTGVCRIEEIANPTLPGVDTDKLYYKLSPIVRGGVVYTPVDTKVPMRPAITRLEARQLLSEISSIQPEVYEDLSVQELNERYSESVGTHRCRDLAQLAMSIYRRKTTPERQRCKYGRVDVKFMKLAEELLCGELSAVLELPYDEIKDRFADSAAMAQ